MWVRKNPANFPPNSPTKCPSQKSENSPTSFCRSAGRKSASGFGQKGSFGKGCFQKSHFLEILENLEILERPQTVKNKGQSQSFSRDSRECRDCRDFRDSSSEKTPFVVTPFPVPIHVLWGN